MLKTLIEVIFCLLLICSFHIIEIGSVARMTSLAMLIPVLITPILVVWCLRISEFQNAGTGRQKKTTVPKGKAVDCHKGYTVSINRPFST